jgi:diaminopimelate epimerase
MLRKFAKYEALGNDFVILDSNDFSESLVTAQNAQALCDRHRGVGADGVLWIDRLGPCDVRLIIVNADGSRPEMCGNGVRCIAAFLADDHGLRTDEPVQLRTDAGPRPVTLVRRDGESAWISSVEMGVITVDLNALMTFTSPADTAGSAQCFFADAGNPHAVVLGAFDEHLLEQYAAQIRTLTERYPQGTNVEFVTHEADAVRVRVHERGVGWTLACGTGACAVSAVLAARENSDTQVCTVRLDGGTLSVKVQKVQRLDVLQYTAVMVGSARRVFDGLIDDRGLR